jgi:uncharacterized protein YjbJ (UPF0337 family)
MKNQNASDVSYKGELLMCFARQQIRFASYVIQGVDMNKDQTHGITEQVKGKINEVVGHITGNKAQEVKGDLQQGVGKAQKVVGDAREAAKRDAKHDANR